MPRSAFVVVVCAALLNGGLAHAQKAGFKRDIARTHYQLGAKYYEVAQYRKALAAFNEAYKLEPMAGLLYNIARCHEALGELEPAIKQYREYLKQRPGAPKKAVLLVKIENLEKAQIARRASEAAAKQAAATKAAATRPAVQQPVVPAALPVEPAEQPAPVPEHSPGRGGWIKTGGWITLGVGGAALIAGAALGGVVGSKQADYEAAQGKTWPELQAMEDDARTYEAAHTGLLISGGVLAAVGGGMLIYHYLLSPAEQPARVTLAPLVGGPAVGFCAAGRF